MSGTFISGTGQIGQGAGKKRVANLNSFRFALKKRRLFWLVFWPRMVARWCPMHFGGARWSLGVPGWCPGTARGLPGGFRAHKECLEKFRKLCFLTPSRKMERFGGFISTF